MGEVTAILERTLELLADEKHWTQGTAYRDRYGKMMYAPDETENGSMCLTGALAYATYQIHGGYVHLRGYVKDLEAARILVTTTILDFAPGTMGIIHFNDMVCRSHEDVILVLKKALHTAQEEGI